MIKLLILCLVNIRSNQLDLIESTIVLISNETGSSNRRLPTWQCQAARRQWNLVTGPSRHLQSLQRKQFKFSTTSNGASDGIFLTFFIVVQNLFALRFAWKFKLWTFRMFRTFNVQHYEHRFSANFNEVHWLSKFYILKNVILQQKAWTRKAFLSSLWIFRVRPNTLVSQMIQFTKFEARMCLIALCLAIFAISDSKISRQTLAIH